MDLWKSGRCVAGNPGGLFILKQVRVHLNISHVRVEQNKQDHVDSRAASGSHRQPVVGYLRRACARCHLFTTMDDLYNLEWLNLVAKISQEILNHTGMYVVRENRI
jgi:hypothetical protein